MRALIVEDGASTGVLAAARALATGGWAVGIGTPGRGGLAAWSRSARFRHVVPAAQDDTDLFLDEVSHAVAQHGYDLVFGGGDAEVLALSSGRDRIGATVPYAEHGRLVQALDKLHLARAAEAAGLASPATEPATASALDAVDGPVMVKPRWHWLPGARGAPGRCESTLCTGRAQAAARVAEIRAAGADPLLQEPVPGRLGAVAMVIDRDGEVVAAVQQEAEGLWPPGAGRSSRAHTVPVETMLVDGVVALLRDLGWFGLAQIQFVRPVGGDAMVIDLNGRFYGSLALAVAAGANLPAKWAELAAGCRPGPDGADGVVRTGLRYQWLEGDLRRAAAERRGGLVRDVVGCLAYAPGAVASTWRVEDPWPALRYAGVLARRGTRKLLSGAGPRSRSRRRADPEAPASPG